MYFNNSIYVFIILNSECSRECIDLFLLKLYKFGPIVTQVKSSDNKFYADDTHQPTLF